MKKFLAVILALLAIFACLPMSVFDTVAVAAVEGTNIVVNPSFESDGSWSPSSSAWSVVSAENGVTPASGSRMMKVCATSTNICPGTSISVDPYSYYTYSAKIYRKDTAGVAYINLIDGSSHADIVDTVVGTDNAGQWETVSISIYTGGRNYICPRMVVDNGPSGQPVYFDDISLVKTGTLESEAVSSFVAASDSTKASFTITQNGMLMNSLSTGKEGAKEYITSSIPVALVSRINNANVTWNYQSYKAVNVDRGIAHTVTFKSADEKYELKAVITQHEDVGPLEFNQYITGLTTNVSLCYTDAVAASIKLSLDPSETAVLNRFSRSRMNDGSDEYFTAGDLKTTLTPGANILTSVENHYLPVGSILPFQVIDINGDHGVYIGHYWSFGKMQVGMNADRQVTIYDVLGTVADRWIKKDKGVELAVPGFFIGTYEGDVDDGSNDMKHWYWEYKITRSLYENEGEPYISMGIISDKVSNMDTQFRLWPDFADYVNVIKQDYGWTVPDGFAFRQDVAREDLWLPDAKFGTTNPFTGEDNGVPYYGLYEALQAQVEKDASDKPVYFSLYMVDTYRGVDIGTKYGRELQLQALKERMRPEDNDYGIGYDYWRSDFDVEQSYDYDDHEGLLYILDSMIEYSDDFRYEHCMGGGSLKDFTTLERMTFMTTEDTAFPLNHRVSLYHNSYMIHPVQMKADLNLTLYTRHCGRVKPSPANILDNGGMAHESEDYLTYCMRTSMMGSSMLCLHPAGFSHGNNVQLLREHFGFYNETIRPILRDTSVYHILTTPYATGGNTLQNATNLWYWNDWDGIEYFNHNINQGIVYLFKENTSAPTSKTIKLKGLEADKLYDLTFMDRTNLNTRKTGAQLMSEGITVTGMTTRYDSEIILIEELNDHLKLTTPNRTVFHKGEAIDLTGMKATAYYQDGTTAKVTNYTIEGYDPNTVGVQNVIVKGGGTQGTLEVEVKDHLLKETSRTNATFTANGSVKEGCTYCDYTKSTTIYKASKVVVDKTEFEYIFSDCRPEITIYDSQGTRLIQNTDYTLTYPAGSAVVGTYVAKIKLIGDYSGTKEITYNVNPKVVKNLAVSSRSSNSISLTWATPTGGADGYRVYIFNKDTGEFVSRITSTTELKATIADLNGNTSYKIGVKAYKKNAEGTKLYSQMVEVSGTTTAASVNAPSKLTAASCTTTSIKLSWPKVTGADGYRVYKYNASTGACEVIATITGVTYNVTGLKAGTNYSYAVRAFKNQSGKGYFSDMVVLNTSTNIAAPSKLTVSSRTTSSVKLSWPEVTGATGYRVYRYDASTKTYKTVATTKNLYYSVTGLKSGTNYTFAVKAYKTLSGVTYWSARKTLATSTTPKAPASFKVSTRNTSSIKLSWPKATGATGYRIYRYDSSTKTYKTVATTTNLSYTVKSLKSATNYTFRIKSYKKLSDGTTIWSGYRSLTTATNPVAPLISSVKSSAKGKVTLKWNDVARENGYQIYYATSKTGTYKLLDTVSANDVSETCAGLTSGKTYYFKVRAYKTVNSTKVYSSFSPVKALKIK